MKYCLLLIMIFSGTSFARADFTASSNESLARVYFSSQMGPIYFWYPIPSKISVNDRIDLSFSKSTLITMFRYKLEIPGRGETSTDNNIIQWSAWSSDDAARIIVPRLDVEGSYKLMIEYKTKTSSEAKKVEKLFFVHPGNPLASAVISKSETIKKATSESDKTVIKTTTVTDKTASKVTPVAERTVEKTTPVPDKTTSKTTPANDRNAAKTTSVTDRTGLKTTPAIDQTKTKSVVVNSRISRKKTPVIDKISVNTMSINILPSDSISILNEVIKFKPPVLQNVIITEILDDTEEERTAILIDKIYGNTSTGNIPAAFNLNHGRELIDYKPVYFNYTDTIEDSASLELSSAGVISTEPSTESVASKKIIEPDFTRLLATAIEPKDAEFIKKSIQNGVGIEIKGADGGNIFHIIDDTLGDEDLISLLIKNGVSIDETDNYGNTPLHVAVLSGESNYARSLINQGAKMDIRNKLELSPLHMAALLNNREIANYMIVKGAEFNIKGNSGYTPLHIASEMNHISIAKDLLHMGADNKVKTEQGLTPGAIAKIQNNYEMNKLISKKDSSALKTSKSILTNSDVLLNKVKLNPKYDFNLPYDKQLVKKRQFSKVVRIISIPVFVLSAAGVTYLKSEANHYYTLSKTAETEVMAKGYYNKTKKFDRYAYISGGISLISVYSFIHSTIRKKNISNKMRKKFNQED